MSDRIIIQQNVADRLVGTDDTDGLLLGRGAGTDKLDPLRQVSAADAEEASPSDADR